MKTAETIPIKPQPHQGIEMAPEPTRLEKAIPGGLAMMTIRMNAL